MRSISFIAFSLSACAPGVDLDLDLTQSEAIPTVFTATVDGEASGLDGAWVEYGLGGEFGLQAPLDLDAELPWEVELLGMKPGVEYQARIAVELDGESFSGRAHTVTTGLAPADLPNLVLERGEGESFEGFLVTSVVGNSTAAVILDQDGDYVWWSQPDGLDMVGRTVLSRDRSELISMELNPNGDQAGAFARISLDGTQEAVQGVDWMHHDFHEHEDGTIAFLAKDPQSVGGATVKGASIQELGPDGEITTVWSIWDDPDRIPYDEAGGQMAGEWPHANALAYLPDEDAYLIGFLFLDAIARVDRASGTLDWVMGGAYSDFTTASGSTDLFERTHHMNWLDGNLLVFVNGSAQGGESYALEVAVDEDRFEVEPVWEYWADPAMSCVSLGDVDRLDSGNTLITYSYNGVIQEVTEQGELVWSLSASAGGVITYVTPVEDLY